MDKKRISFIKQSIKILENKEKIPEIDMCAILLSITTCSLGTVVELSFNDPSNLVFLRDIIKVFKNKQLCRTIDLLNELPLFSNIQVNKIR